MDGALEGLLWLPFGLGVLLALAAVGGVLTLLAGHVFGGGRDLGYRLQALVAAAGCLVVPVAVAGYRSPGWHDHLVVRAAEVVFGLGLIGVVVYAVVALRRSGGGGPRATERLPGQAPALQGVLLGVLAAVSGVVYVAHGLGALTFPV